jgi:Putative prokaryotic signal transducing protein
MLYRPSKSSRIEPRFCPDCGHTAGGAPEQTLCSHCGEVLQLQGYCDICESRLRLSVGMKCPKHDVVLVSNESSSTTGSRAARPISWVTLTRFPDSMTVAPARIRLEAEGIPTFVDGERMGGLSMYRVATGGVKLQVPAELVNEARIILSQCWSLESDETDIDDDVGEVVESWEDPFVEPSPSRMWIAEAILILVLVSPLIVWLLVRYYGHP